ncbi:DUF4179 domain-containing protein [Salibacterium aidingense]|uniref:DUF4179 domain-containing protein n=1 Tax=Salibacterium aidingense TaxID=384933 RepID=UPI0003FEF210|nr:DUF4179 domain-containing protein [Salibacterium aidingense]
MQARRLVHLLFILSIIPICFHTDNVAFGEEDRSNEEEDNKASEFQLDSIILQGPFDGISAAYNNGLTSTINQSVTDNGVTLTINDVYYFGNEISYSYSIETNKSITAEKVKTYPPNLVGKPKIKMDGKRYDYSGRSWSKEVSKGKHVGIYTMTPMKTLPTEGKLNIKFNKAANFQGNWTFNFPIKEVQGEDIKIVKTDIPETRDVKITFAKMNAAEIAMTADVKRDINDENMLFGLLDENGNLLTKLHFLGRSVNIDEKTASKYIYKFSVPHENTEKFTLAPVKETKTGDQLINKEEKNSNIFKKTSNILGLY